MSEPDGGVPEREWVIGFVRGRDVPCPRCGYNLRDLVEARCPECAEELRLHIGIAVPRVGWLIAAMAPGLFSMVCAALVAVPLTLHLVWRMGGSGPPWPVYTAEAFGIASALFAYGLYRRRRVIIQWPVSRQVRLAVVNWVVHIAAFGLLVWAMSQY